MIRYPVVSTVILTSVLLFSGFNSLPVAAVVQPETAGLAAPLYSPGSGGVDLLIITPEEFAEDLQPLMEHKSNSCMQTVMITLELIYSSYEGADEPEKVKQAIKYYYDTLGIRYVMLVGDCNKFPVRWQLGHFNDALIDDDDPDNDDRIYTAADFYYADLYDDEGAFNDWDADGDGYYGEIYRDDLNSDGIDPVPEVAVGRIPAATGTQLQTYVDKIIDYEMAAHASDWFENLLLIQVGWSDELYVKENISQTLGFRTTRLYDSINASIYSGPIDGVPNSVTITEELNNGYGFVSELYHGAPDSWGYLFSTGNVSNLTNAPMLPVIYTGACETAKFYGSSIPYRTYEGVDGGTYGGVAAGTVGGTPLPQPDPIQTAGNVLGIGESFLVSSQNGAIGYYGCLETGEPMYHKVLEEAFFTAFSLGHHVLGDMWSYAVGEFAEVQDLLNLTANNEWGPVCRMHTPSRYVLLGDPSLRVGGINAVQDPLGAEWSTLFALESGGNDIIYDGENFVVAGWQQDEIPDGYWTILAKYDRDGNLVDSVSYSGEDDRNRANALIYDSTNDRYLAAGEMHHFFEEDGHEYYMPWVWMAALDDGFNPEWDHVYDNGQPFADAGNDIVKNVNGYIIGGWRDMGGGAGSGYLQHTDTDGVIDWQAWAGSADGTGWMHEEILSVFMTNDGGLILGTTSGMVKVSLDGGPVFEWRAGEGSYKAVRPVMGDCYIGVGMIEVDGPAGENPYDMVITKVDDTGTVIWSETWGRSSPVVGADGMSDVGLDVIGHDSGYIVTGSTQSYACNGGTDMFVARYDTDGNQEWVKVMGDEGADVGRAVVADPGGGYVVTGHAEVDGVSRLWTVKVSGDYVNPSAFISHSPDSQFVGKPFQFSGTGSPDPDGWMTGYIWDYGDNTTSRGAITNHAYDAPGTYTVTLYVIDNDGLAGEASTTVTVKNLDVQWDRDFGDTAEYGKAIVAAPDGGYVVAGMNTSGYYGDSWIFKINSSGTIVWSGIFQLNYSYTDLAHCIVSAHGGGYIAAGARTLDSGGQITGNSGIWIMKLAEENGAMVWQKFYDYGPWDDAVYDIRQDGNGYICTGQISTGGETKAYQTLLLRIDADGNEVWHEIISDADGSNMYGHSVTPTADGGYAVTGEVKTGKDPFFTVKLRADRTEEWRRYFGEYMGVGKWITRTPDQGYVVAGHADGDYALVKFTPGGYVDWSSSWDFGYWQDYVTTAAVCPDGGYILIGQVYEVDTGRTDMYIVKTDASGNTLWDWKSNTDTVSEGGDAILVQPDGDCIVVGHRTPVSGNITGTLWIFKLGANSHPEAEFDFEPPMPSISETVWFNGSLSSDPDGVIYGYHWDFGTGDEDTGVTANYEFPAAGDYDVTLTVVDNDGAEDSVTHTVSFTVISVNFSANTTSGMAPLSVSFSADVSEGTPPVTWAWDFDNNGTVDSTDAGPSWLYEEPGVYTVALEVTDGVGHSAVRTRSDYIIVSGIAAGDPGVTITTAEFSDDPASDPETYDPSLAPPGINWENARGFNLVAAGEDGVYTFRITFETPVAEGFLLYKIDPVTGEWIETGYTVIDEYTIEVTLNIIGGELDPPFVLAEIPPVLTGDADGDGDVDIVDITKVTRVILTLDAETPGSDVNQDGTVDVRDMTKIARVILGLE